jgi:hypothetical protein
MLRSGKLDPIQERQIRPITLDEVEEIKNFFPMAKYFIFGHARSGTTLLTRLIRLHPEVHCNYQAHFFTRKPLWSEMISDSQSAKFFYRRSNRWNRGKDLTTVALRSMADYILESDARLEGKTIVGDKSPNVRTNGRAVTEMHTFYPEARLIYIVRDGRDTLVSHRFQHWIDGVKHLPRTDIALRDAFAKDPAPFLSGKRSIFTESSIRRMAEGWVKNVFETDQMGQELYGDHYHVLRYEDLLSHPYETIAKVWQFLGADPTGLDEIVAQEMERNPDADYQRKAAGELVKNLEKGKRDSWRALFTEEDKRIFKEIAGETLITWGYEKDLEW